MKKLQSRRDFLKLASLLPASYISSLLPIDINRHLGNQNTKQNVIVIVLDAFSAYHLPLYGYQRNTTPNISRLAEQAIVYHNHYAGGNFTTPGTASILTGAIPWTHRAVQPNGTVAKPFEQNNIFNIAKDYYTIAYTHNPWADTLLQQLQDNIDELVPRLSLFLDSYDEIIHKLFKKDDDIASVSWFRNADISDSGYAYSLFLSHIYKALHESNIKSLRAEYPRGIPSIGRLEANFVLDHAIDWLGNRLPKLPQPFLGYFHFLPPHGPYRTPIEFMDVFTNDGYTALKKPDDVFSEGKPYELLRARRNLYDEFILHADDQFNNLYNQLRNSGLTENTWIILTSDHGEMFERGIDGHSNNAMYQPVIRVPLLIFEPGRTKGENIFAPTSAIDLLPTICQITGQDAPAWAEGKVLPPYTGQSPDPKRDIYVVRANKTEKDAPITQASITITRDRYKLHYYRGYNERGLLPEFSKLYDIESDPEELTDLSDTHKEIAFDLLDEIKRKLDDANQHYT